MIHQGSLEIRMRRKSQLKCSRRPNQNTLWYPNRSIVFTTAPNFKTKQASKTNYDKFLTYSETFSRWLPLNHRKINCTKFLLKTLSILFIWSVYGNRWATYVILKKSRCSKMELQDRYLTLLNLAGMHKIFKTSHLVKSPHQPNDPQKSKYFSSYP